MARAKNGNGNGQRNIILPILIALVSGAAVQVAAGLIWGGKIMTHIEQLEARDVENMKALDRIDTRGTQQLPIIDQRLKNFEEIVKHQAGRIDTLQQQNQAVNPITQLQLDALKASVLKLEEQIRRNNDAVEALTKSRR